MSDLRSPSDPSLWSASKFACPACGFQLRRYDARIGVLLWCDRGPCPSFKANDGATGPNEDRAYAELVVNCEAEGWDEP